MRPAKPLQKGYIVAMKYYTNIPVSIKAVTEFRVKVLEHKAKYGIKSTMDASRLAAAPSMLGRSDTWRLESILALWFPKAPDRAA